MTSAAHRKNSAPLTANQIAEDAIERALDLWRPCDGPRSRFVIQEMRKAGVKIERLGKGEW